MPPKRPTSKHPSVQPRPPSETSQPTFFFCKLFSVKRPNPAEIFFVNILSTKVSDFDSLVFLRMVTWAVDQQLIIPLLEKIPRNGSSGACCGVKSPVVARSCKHACCITFVSSQNMSFKTRNSKTNHRILARCVLNTPSVQGCNIWDPESPTEIYHLVILAVLTRIWHHRIFFALGVHRCFQENSSKSRCESWIEEICGCGTGVLKAHVACSF